MQPRVQRQVAGVVAEQGQLDQVVAGPGQQRVVVGPGVRVDQGLVRHPGQVLPAGRLQGERLPDRGFGVRGLLALVVPDRLPEALDEPGVVPVAVLADAHPGRSPPAGRPRPARIASRSGRSRPAPARAPPSPRTDRSGPAAAPRRRCASRPGRGPVRAGRQGPARPARSGRAVPGRARSTPASAGRAGAARAGARPAARPPGTRTAHRRAARAPTRPARARTGRRPACPIQDRSRTVLPLPGGADTTVTRAEESSCPHSPGRGTIPFAPARRATESDLSAGRIWPMIARASGPEQPAPGPGPL